MVRETTADEWGWASILAAGAGFFIYPFVPLFSILGIVFGFVSIVRGAFWKGFLGVILSVAGILTIVTFGGLCRLLSD